MSVSSSSSKTDLKWDSSKLRKNHIERLFGHDGIIYDERCPLSTNTSMIPGDTAIEIFPNIIEQLEEANLHFKIKDVKDITESISENVEKAINSSCQFIQELTATEISHENKKSLMDRPDLLVLLYDAVDECPSEIRDFVRALEGVASEKMQIYNAASDASTCSSSLHSKWLKIYQALLNMIITQPCPAEHWKYRLLENGDCSFQLDMREKFWVACNTFERQMRTVTAHPDSVVGMTTMMRDAPIIPQPLIMTRPILFIEVKTSSTEDVDSEKSEKSVVDWKRKCEGYEANGQKPSKKLRSSSSFDNLLLRSSTFSHEQHEEKDQSDCSMNSNKSASSPAPFNRSEDEKLTPQRSCSPVEELKSQHFIQLVAAMKDQRKKNIQRPSKAFGLYAITNRVYLTCVRLEDEKVLNKKTKDNMLKLVDEAPNMFRMSCTQWLDIFQPEHLRALMWYLNMLLVKEMQYVDFMENV